jgi:hypothetical protein
MKTLFFILFIFIANASSLFARDINYSDWTVCRYKSESLWGYCDCRKELLYRTNPEDVKCVRIEPKFKQASVFYDDPYAPAMDATGKWGFIDPSGEWVIEPQFDGATVVRAGKSSVTVDNRTRTINIQTYTKQN